MIRCGQLARGDKKVSMFSNKSTVHTNTHKFTQVHTNTHATMGWLVALFCFESSKSGVAGMQVIEHLSYTVQTMAVFRSHLMPEENRLLLEQNTALPC